jgi:uncharacterized protein YycO
MRGKRTLLLIAAAALPALAGGCPKSSLVVKRPQPQTDSAITKLWADEVRANAQDGDWILSRSYSFVGDVITGITRGEEWSHASMYDAERDVIIEADADGVHETSLNSFVRRNYHIAIMRPAGTTPADRRAALERVRSKIGAKYDWTGLVGIDNPDRFTCAELVLWSAEPDRRGWHVPIVVAPSDLPRYGDEVFYTGTRDDVDVQVAARSADGAPVVAAARPRSAPTATLASR